MKGTFLWRNRVLLTSTGLMIIALHMITVGVNPGSRAMRPSSLLLGLVEPVEASFSRFGTGIDAVFHDYLDLVHIRQENAQLRAELARVKTDRARLAELEVENRHLSELLELKDALGLDAVAATVVGSDATGLSRTLVLGQGTAEGLQPGMAVLSIQGVVGRVIAATPHASRVLLINDHNSALDGFDQRSRARGIVAGVVDDGLAMKYVDRSEDVQDGDTVVTSGLDGIFPRGLLVGNVKTVRREGPGMFVSVGIAPAVDFRSLEQVLVVTQALPHIEDDPRS